MGIGDWGLGLGPNPQSPIPNPQSKYFSLLNKIIKIFRINKFKIFQTTLKFNKYISKYISNFE